MLKGALKAAVVASCLAERFVQIEVVLARVDDAAGDVGAVVGRALQVGQEVGEHKAGLNAARALLHAQDMARAHLLFERVDDLLQRLDLLCGGGILTGKGLERERKDLAVSTDSSLSALPEKVSPFRSSSSAEERMLTAWSEMRSKSPMVFKSSVASSLSSRPIFCALSLTR